MMLIMAVLIMVGCDYADVVPSTVIDIYCALQTEQLKIVGKCLLKYCDCVNSQIKEYNSSGEQAVEQVKQSMRRLDNITAKINEANSILSQDFYDNVRDNDQTLELLSQVM